MNDYSIVINFPEEVREGTSVAGSIDTLRQVPIDAYIKALLQEIRSRSIEAYWQEKTLVDINFKGLSGGYTQGRLIADLISEIFDCFRPRAGVRVGVSTSPQSLSDYCLRDFVWAGVQQCLIEGVSFDSTTLRHLGLPWDAKYVEEVYSAALRANFAGVGLALSYGTQKQRDAMFRVDLERILELKPDFVGFSPIVLPDGHALFDVFSKIRKTRGNPVSRDILKRMRMTVASALECLGYDEPFVNEFTRRGSTWRTIGSHLYFKSLLGVGVGAQSRCVLSDGRILKDVNTSSPRTYVEETVRDQPTMRVTQDLTFEEEVNEYISFELQGSRGLGLKDFERIFGFRVEDVQPGLLEVLVDLGLIWSDGVTVKLTALGIVQRNEAIGYFRIDSEDLKRSGVAGINKPRFPASYAEVEKSSRHDNLGNLG